MTIVAPSLLGADLLHLGDEVRRVKEWGASWIHFDHMDGHFVPNISFGPAFVAAVRKQTDLFLDVHLMLSDPVSYIKKYADAGADGITIHAEANDAQEAVGLIRSMGKKVGIAINPETPTAALNPFIETADLILVMTVHPGFGGQKLIPECLDKVRELRRVTSGLNRMIKFETDGGIHTGNAQDVVQAGSDVLVMGTGLFQAEDPAGIIRKIERPEE
ncbi:MAG: ribulose-phosphate 3-epimerase [Clostridiales bacterium]|nr:ribulose-phosphate 3-epimerase [Clostridiales bacterium]